MLPAGHPNDTEHTGRSVRRFEGWYGAGYNHVMRRGAIRKLVYTGLGGAPALRDLPTFIDRATSVHPTDGTLLDVPCGEGVVERLLDKRAWHGRVIAVDLAARAVARVSQLQVGYELDVVRGSALDLPLDDASIDTVISINGLHVMPDHGAFLAEIARVLTPGGSAWLTTITSGPGVRRRGMIRAVRQLGVLPVAPPTESELEQLITHAGLHVVDRLGGSTVVALQLQRATTYDAASRM